MQRCNEMGSVEAERLIYLVMALYVEIRSTMKVAEEHQETLLEYIKDLL